MRVWVLSLHVEEKFWKIALSSFSLFFNVETYESIVTFYNMNLAHQDWLIDNFKRTKFLYTCAHAHTYRDLSTVGNYFNRQ